MAAAPPGCTSTWNLEAHHVHHGLHGGPTDLDNLILLCASVHHTADNRWDSYQMNLSYATATSPSRHHARDTHRTQHALTVAADHRTH